MAHQYSGHIVWRGSETEWQDHNIRPPHQPCSTQDWLCGCCTLCHVSFHSDHELQAHCATGVDHSVPEAFQIIILWDCSADEWRIFRTWLQSFFTAVRAFGALCEVCSERFTSVVDLERHFHVHDHPPPTPLVTPPHAGGRTYQLSRPLVPPTAHTTPTYALPAYPRRADIS